MSDSERSTADVVRETIERDGSIKVGLARGLINSRALARYIQVQTMEKYSFDGILSAIRRYPVKASAAKHHSAGKLISKIELKNKIAVATIKNTPEVPTKLAEFSKQIDYGRGETFRVVSGPESVFVVVDSKNLGKVVSTASKGDLLMTQDNLSEIVLKESEEALTTSGIIAAWATELAMNGVNVVACAAPPTSAIFIVKQEDALRAYQTIESMGRG